MPHRQSAILLFVALTLAGCNLTGTSQLQEEEHIWLRTDGKSGRDNPAIAEQFRADEAACTVGRIVDRACMTKRAYIRVPISQAEATAARLRAASGGT